MEVELHAAEQQRHSTLKTVEMLLKEAEQKLTCAIRGKDMDQVAVAHAIYEAATRKMQEANEALNAISLQRQELMTQKNVLANELAETVNLESSSNKFRTTVDASPVAK
jgi:hypothetical protein